MRGKAPFRFVAVARGGITPAYAGKRSFRQAGKAPPQDHPRLCGEKEQRAARIFEILGSPPPMRGKASCDRAAAFYKRITPAYAGKR